MALLRVFTVMVVLCLVVPMTAFGQALPKPDPQPERVNRAISGVLQQGMQRRGFAANDHRFMNTVARVGPGLSKAALGGAAAAVTLGAVTAPAWATVAIAAGIGTAVTYAVSLGLDAIVGLVTWYFRDDGLIDQSSEAEKQRDPSTGVTAGLPAWRIQMPVAPGVTREAWGGDGLALAREAFDSWYRFNGSTKPDLECKVSSDGRQAYCGAMSAVYVNNGPSQSCAQGSYLLIGEGCLAYSFPIENVVEDKTGVTPQEAIDNLPEEVLDEGLNPEIIAALANRAWQQAAIDPNYDGLPFPQSNPLTAADALPWIKANPDLAPTVRDFVSPNPTTNSSSNPWSLPANPTSPTPTPAQPNQDTVNPGAGNPTTNLGPDPGIGAPTLEAIPTAQQIAQPILDMLPDLRGYSPSSHTGECPRPTIELYGTHVLDAHCILIDDNKAIIQAAMLLAWALIALFIVLSA